MQRIKEISVNVCLDHHLLSLSFFAIYTLYNVHQWTEKEIETEVERDDCSQGGTDNGVLVFWVKKKKKKKRKIRSELPQAQNKVSWDANICRTVEADTEWRKTRLLCEQQLI